jgi:HEAT repeat protein
MSTNNNQSNKGSKLPEMKKSRFIILLSLLVGALFIFTFSTGLPGQTKPTDEEADQLRSSKTVQILLEESYGSAKNIVLPVKETVEKLLPPTGLKHVMSNADITLNIETKGRAISRYYSGGGKGQTGYTGASVSGTIYLKKGDRKFFKKSFSGRVSPGYSIFKGSYKTPSSAPFKKAFSRSSFTIKIMEIFREIKGNDLIYAYLENDDWQIRKQAAILLGNLKINDASAVNSLITALKDKRSDVRIESVQALEKIKDPLSIDPLINLLPDESLRVRNAVRKALNKIDRSWKERESCQDLIPSTLSALKNKKYGIREGAVEFFAEIYDQRALKPLMMTLMDKSTGITKKAVKALDKNYPNWRTSEPAAELVPHFIRSLKSPSYDTRKGAIFALEEITDPRALEPLINVLKDTNTNVRAAALRTLDKKYQDWGSGKAARKLIPYYARALQSTSVSNRTHAVKVLAGIKDPQVVQPLIRAIKDKSYKVKEIAVKALAESDNPAVVKPLIGVINDKSTTVRAAVIKALGKLNTPGADEVEPLINAMQDKVSSVRKSAVEALGQKQDDRVIEPLVAALKDTSTSVQAAAAKVLGERKEPRAVKPLIDLLKSRDRKVRTSANQALEKLGEFLPVESLIELLKDKDYNLRNSARDLLAKIKNPAAVEVLITSLKNEDIKVRRAIIYSLGKLKDPRAIEPLVEILNSLDRWERKDAENALKSINGPLVEQNDPRVVKPLIGLLKSKDSKTRTYAFTQLAKLADFLPVEPVIELLKDKDYKVRNKARDLLLKIKNPGAVEVLIASLKSEDIKARKEIIFILGKCNDNRAVEPLIEILKSKDKWEKKRAAEALKSITGKDYGVKYKKWKKWWKKNKNKSSV